MTCDPELERGLKVLLRAWGATVMGFADTAVVEDLPQWARCFPRAVSVAIALSRTVLGRLEDGPTILYKHHYRTVNHALDRIALAASGWLQERGYEALPIPASVLVDWKEHLGHLSHRAVAVAAGLGWMGRSNLVVTSAWGCAVRLVTILTNAPLPAGDVLETGCGTCEACRVICPADAIGESSRVFRRWDCLEKLRELSRERNLGVHICGLCQKACAYQATTWHAMAPENQ
jgi:epoxyqueuosine reductase